MGKQGKPRSRSGACPAAGTTSVNFLLPTRLKAYGEYLLLLCVQLPRGEEEAGGRKSICAVDGERALGTRCGAVLERAIFSQRAGREGGGEGRIGGVIDGGFGELSCNYN